MMWLRHSTRLLFIMLYSQIRTARRCFSYATCTAVNGSVSVVTTWINYTYLHLQMPILNIYIYIYIIITKNICYLLWNKGLWRSLNNTYPIVDLKFWGPRNVLSYDVFCWFVSLRGPRTISAWLPFVQPLGNFCYLHKSNLAANWHDRKSVLDPLVTKLCIIPLYNDRRDI